MPAVLKNLTIEMGGMKRVRFTPRTAGGMPLDLSGYKARMQIRDEAGMLVDELTSDNGRIILGGPAGTVEITFPATVTAAVTVLRASYDLELEPPAGPEETWKLARGSVRYLPEVTHG